MVAAMSSAPFSILTLDHVVLRARNVAAMERFYCEVLGCAVVKRQGKVGLVHLSAGRSLIDLLDLDRANGGGPEGRNMDHLCLRVEPFDEAAIRAHFGAHGVACGEVERRFGAEGTGPSIYLQDPEGNTVELKGPAEG